MTSRTSPESRSGFAPEKIRALRGAQSRALFAERVGVTPNTVYRWELPVEAAEARRPRGNELEKLRQLEQREGTALSAERAEAPSPSSVLAPALPRPRLNDDDLVEALPAVERIFRSEARRGQAELVALLASRRNLSADARATAGFG